MSASQDIDIVPYLEQISSKTLLADDFWPKFFSLDELRVIDFSNIVVVEAVGSIIANGVNVVHMVEAAADLIQRVNSQSNRGKYTLTDVNHATAALRFIQLLFHFATINFDVEKVSGTFGVGARVNPLQPESEGSVTNTGVRKLVDAVLTLVATPTVNDTNYDLMLEGVNFLVVLMCDQLYTPFQSSKEEMSQLAIVSDTQTHTPPPPPTAPPPTQSPEAAPSTFASWLGFGQPPSPDPPSSNTSSPSPAAPPLSQDTQPSTPPPVRRYLGLELVMEWMEPEARHRQASDIIKAILKWVIQRPEAPPLVSNPASARAVDSHARVQHQLEQQSLASTVHGVNAGSPINLAAAQRNLTSSLTSIASAVLYLPLLPFLRMYSFLFMSASSNQPRLTGPPTSSGLFSNEYPASRSPLCDRGVLLLCLLIHNNRDARTSNPFRRAITQLYDPLYSDVLNQDEVSDLVESGSGLLVGNTDVIAPSTSFENLLESIGKLLSDDSLVEPTSLFLYTLMKSSSAFRETTMSRSDLEFIVLPLLKSLYNAHKARSPSSLYITAILLLSFTQDEGFNVTAFQHLFVATVPWYQERYLRQMSLGSLITLCVVRTLIYTLSKLNDLYLLENCLAILSNLGPHLEHLHAYAAQRLIAVAITVMKKLCTYMEELKSLQGQGAVMSESDPAVLQPSSSQSSERLEELQQFIFVYSRCVEVMVKVLNACSRTKQIGKNSTIIYALMHRHTEVAALLSNPHIASQYPVATLKDLLAFITHRVEESAELDLSVEKTSEIIERGVAAYTASADMECLDDVPLKIAHQEPDDPESFFVPYAWGVTQVHTNDLGWNTTKLDSSMGV